MKHRWIRPLWLALLGIALFLGSAVQLTYQQYQAQKILGPGWHVVSVQPTGGVLYMGAAGMVCFIAGIVWGVAAFVWRLLAR